MSVYQITTIKPVSGLFVSFKPRNKEGEAEKQEVFASYFLPEIISQIANPEIKAFSSRAFAFALELALKESVRNGKAEFSLALQDMFAAATREFLITKKDLEAWLDGFALPLVSAAISAKSGIPADSVKVVKKALAYKELMLSICSRSLMQQSDIDAAIKVLELVATSGQNHPYTDNVATGIERKQSKLNDWLAGKSDTEDEIDF